MKALERKLAEEHRKKGLSIKEIARRLDVSQSTVSLWCRDIALSPAQKAFLKKRQMLASARALRPWIERSKKEKRDDIVRQKRNGEKDLGKVSKRDLFVLGLGLYWGEGYKKGSQECAFTNSDPAIIRTILEWLFVCYGVSNDRIHVSLTINDLYRNQEKDLIEMWCRNAKLQRNQFDTSTFISGYGNNKKSPNTYTGTLRVKVRNGTSLRRRILASIQAIQY